jgi:exosortase/archaeosortase family protein
MLAVSAAHGVLCGIGVDVVRSGTMLASASGSFSMDVADPCSGLRSLFAMMTLSAGYGYFTQPTWGRRVALFALSVPIAVVGNVVRIVTIAVVGTTCSAEFASGFYHDYSGYVVFLVAVSLMVATGGLISQLCDRASAGRKAKEGAASAAVTPCSAACGWKIAVPFVAAVLVVGTMAMQGALSEPALCEAPAARLGELAGFRSETIPPAEAELNVLPKDTVIDKRVYTAPDGNWYKVTLVVGGRSKGSIHRPEMCLPSQGFLMKDPEVTDVAGMEWRTLTVERGRETSLGFAYTFFNQEGFRTSSHVRRIFRDVIDRSFRRRIDRWAMVTVTSSDADRGRLSKFLLSLKEVVE